MATRNSRAFMQVSGTRHRAAGGRAGCTAPPLPPAGNPPHPRCLFSAEWRGDSRPRDALQYERASSPQNHGLRKVHSLSNGIKSTHTPNHGRRFSSEIKTRTRIKILLNQIKRGIRKQRSNPRRVKKSREVRILIEQVRIVDSGGGKRTRGMRGSGFV
ncbi:unnamed protein product [Parnassius apollo]|uniref:(apollo) hypothetical protein n=1 Tax=Parnassius apollo TaxID=110799 RepID=A0A8S3WUK1_PARAO|nr:unnamed protein product [Parnassius apollo]